MAKKRKKPIPRGPKGGRKHTPGRDHDLKSKAGKTKRFSKTAKRLREEQRKEALRQWSVWDSLNDEQKHFREDLRPQYPRPTDDA